MQINTALSLYSVRRYNDMLSTDMLERLKVITDVFYEIDSISFEQAVAINEEDANPESNIAIFEEMVRVYKEFSDNRALSIHEKKEIYNVLLLRTFYGEEECVKRLELKGLPFEDALHLIRQYKLEPTPAVIYVEG
jgi:hypothetical protein